MLLQEIRDGTSNKKDAKKVEAKLTLRLVDNKEKLSGRITVTYTRGGYPVFHAKDLSPDEVRHIFWTTKKKHITTRYASHWNGEGSKLWPGSSSGRASALRRCALFCGGAV